MVVVTTLLGIVLAGVSWWVKNIWAMVTSQQEQITKLNIELAKNYATRSEFQATVDKIFDKLDEIQREMRNTTRA
jgi:cell division protein FtsB